MKKMIIVAAMTALAIAMTAPLTLAQTAPKSYTAGPAASSPDFPSAPGSMGGYAQGQGGYGPGMMRGQGQAQGQGMYRSGSMGGYAQGQGGYGPGMMGGQAQPQGQGQGAYGRSVMGGYGAGWMGGYGGIGVLILLVVALVLSASWHGSLGASRSEAKVLPLRRAPDRVYPRCSMFAGAQTALPSALKLN